MKHLPYFFAFLFSLISFNANSQKYHESDKEGLRTLLRESYLSVTGSVETNFEGFGLQVSDTLDWNSSEDWVSKIKGVVWSDDLPKRLLIFSNGLYVSESSKVVDFSYFSDLTALEVHRQVTNAHYFLAPQLKISSLSKLIHISAIRFSFDTNDFKWFPQLEYLRLNTSHIGNISLSKNTKLKYLDCAYENDITELDLSNNVELEVVKCQYNYTLSKLNTKGLTKLRQLDMSYLLGKSIKEIDLTDNFGLEYLDCNSSGLENLDLSKNLKLDTLLCHGNKIGELDLSGNPNLVSLSCMANEMKKLNVSNCRKLKVLSCPGNRLKELDLSNNPDIEEMYIEKNELESLTLPSVDKKDIVDVSFNKLRMSMLPIPKYRKYVYNGQGDIDGGTIDIGEEIDLSAEYEIAGVKSDYKWYIGNQPAEVVSKGKGRFALPSGFSGRDFNCKITNSIFPALTMTYRVKAGRELDLPTGVETESQSKAMYLESHSVKSGEYIRLINPSVCAGIAELYNANGQLVSKTILSETTSLSVSQKGIYILNVIPAEGNKQSFKIMVY